VKAASLRPSAIILGLAMLCVVSTGCPDDSTTEPLSPTADAPDPPRTPAERVRRRTQDRFGKADLLMPGNLTPGEATSDLAPIILVRDRARGTFGVVSAHASGDLVVPGPLTVYWERSRVVIDGHSHDQIAYYWWFRAEGADAFAVQGVRMTLRENGLACVWEVLRDSSNLRVVYVAESVEAAARKKHGGPLPGRRFSIERKRDATPDIVVARVLPDGPMPMGPWIYVLAGADDVSTVLCRCSPSQTKGPLERTDYVLRPFDPQGRQRSPFVADDPASDPHTRLDTWLRWP
jgi:hypothetical protein